MGEKRKFMVTAALLVLLVIVLLVLLVRPGGGKAAREEALARENAVAEGLSYLYTLEGQDTAPVEETLKDQRRQERIEALQRGEVDVWEQLEDAVIMGDSRAVGFWYFDFMPQERVLGDAGHTIEYVPDYMETLQALNPGQIFLCYGVNDIGIGYWPEPEDWASAMDETIRSIHAVLPDTDVIVCSALPVRGKGLDRNDAWYEIPEYNAVMAQMCAEKGYAFADCAAIAEEFSYYWDIDGIHVGEGFYPYWAQELVTAMYSLDEEG